MTTPFSVVYADPPWKFGDSLPGPKRGASAHYECLTVEQLCMLELPPIADNALLFMWRVAAMKEEALAVIHMWGFDRTPSEIIWVKTRNGVVIADADPLDETDIRMGMGHYTRQCHEVCYIGARGKAASLVKNHAIRSVFTAERQEHSRKPDKMYEIIEKLVDGEGPFVELFGRRQRAGWVTRGLELGTPLLTMTE